MRKKKLLSIAASIVIAMSLLTIAATQAVAQQFTVLHSFNPNGGDGSTPYFGDLIFDAAGNLYGTTVSGGKGTNCGALGCGTAFELSPKAGGGRTEKVLHSFSNDGNDGVNPMAGLIFDAAGNLYGTTSGGGAYGYGTVFELIPTSAGGFVERTLHNFNYDGKDGANPVAGLIFDTAGNLYGTTSRGGPYQGGTAFELTPAAGGVWTEKILHSFGNNWDGGNLWAGLIFDASGNLYGTAVQGGTHFVGVVFELMPEAGGEWREKILHNFGAYTVDGVYPKARLIFDSEGNLYGTTFWGGTVRGENIACAPTCGTVFELTPAAEGGWSEKVLHIFGRGAGEGFHPYSGLVLDAAGNLYGTTSEYGGTVFELKHGAAGGWEVKVLHSFGTFTSDPFAGLTQDASGNLYGTASSGGAKSGGTVFEITP